MLGEIKTITEYHPNGSLWFTTVIAFVNPKYIGFYMNNAQLREWNSSKPYIKIKCEKHFDNGQFGWKLEWNESGELLNKNDKSYRKDGTLIQH